MDARLSVVIITKNEAANIRRCLESVKWADEIVIVDDSSADDTVEIARGYTDKIYEKKMEGFGEQKQFGVDKATGKWILVLDADEELSPPLQEEMKKAIGTEASFDAYRIWRKTFYMGEWIRHCDWYVPILRLFKKAKGRFDMKYVHEEILASGPVGELKNPMHHYSYKNIAQHVTKLDKFTSYDAKELYRQGLRIEPRNMFWYFAVKPPLSFIRKFVLMRGFLDGFNGLVISAFTALAVFLNYAKVWEMQNGRPGAQGPAARAPSYPARVFYALYFTIAVRMFTAGYGIRESVDFVFNGRRGMIRPLQIREEITKFLEIVAARKPRMVLEIGTNVGGTLFLFSRAASRDASILSIDLPGGRFGGGYRLWRVLLYKAFALPGQKIFLIRKDSHRVTTLKEAATMLKDKPVDLLFIDGDHTYEGVRKDFEMYSPLVRKGGIIAFHDIVVHAPESGCEVSRFWEEIKPRYEHAEIIADTDQKMGGIGVLFA
ncbi:MAG: glycosyltransferase [Candidatus Omnitrophica bacterium]|nr:glycosyltransferase [Candidatus Omnitrophota bacterium]